MIISSRPRPSSPVPTRTLFTAWEHFSLDEEPVIAQVPDFGDRFWVYAMYDARTDQFGQLGKPYNSKPGNLSARGSAVEGAEPAGVTDVIRCSTSLANAVPRVFQDDTPEDKKAIQPVIDQIVFYPLKDFTGDMKTIEYDRDAHHYRSAVSRTTAARQNG